jgi:hypothetical protein
MAKSTNRGQSGGRRAGGRRSTDNPEASTPQTPVYADDRTTAEPATAPGQRDLMGMSLKDADTWPSPDEIARRAYEIYESRGGGHGRHFEDWLQAERELRERKNKKKK